MDSTYLLRKIKNEEEIRCPYLGMKNDSETNLNYPSQWNLCHFTVPRKTPHLTHQKNFCLNSHYLNCPVLTLKKGTKMPGKFALREEQAHLTKKLVKYIALACLIVIMALIATLAILNHNKKKLIEPISFSSPTSSPTMLFIEEGLITSTSTSIFVTPTDTPVPTQIISPTPTEIIQSPTPIRIREPHQLEIPFGKEVQFVIHKIVEGEALLYLAEMYRTTTDTIQAVNFGRLYVWPDYLIIIPKDIKDASTLPAFELFMIEQSGLTPEQVASTLSIDLDDFLKYNDLQTGDELFLGEWLLIPRDRIPG